MQAIYADTENTIHNINNKNYVDYNVSSTNYNNEYQNYISHTIPNNNSYKGVSLLNSEVGKDMIAENAKYYENKFLKPTGFTF